MKGPSVIAKNLKLLFRSRESAFTILFGPLLIILLVSAAYTGGEETSIRIGTYAPEYTPLADEVITALKGQGHAVSVYNDREACVEPISTGALHTCVQFPPDFRIKENASNNVTFAVDYSRINLVYEIIEELSSQFQLQGSAISEELAGDVLQRVALAEAEMGSQLDEAALLQAELGEARKALASGSGRLEGVETEVNFTDLKQIRGRVTGLGTLAAELRDEALDAIGEALTALEEAEAETENETQELMEETIRYLERNATERLEELAAEAPTAIEEVGRIVDDAARSIETARERHEELVAASDEASGRMAEAMASLDQAASRLTRMRGRLAHVDESLGRILGLEAGSVASPITTRIEAVNAEEGNLAFTYPYLLMLVIMFLGLMLNSSLIVMDKTSTAAFRNFTTATRDEYHLLLSFVTTFLILLAQTLLILAISYLFVKAPLFNNFGASLLLIVFAITLFSFLGMIVGYLSTTQEAAMIASLSLGSILLFVSNLVLPLEAMNRLVGILSAYNPYVVLSELLKQSILFDLRLAAIPGQLAILSLAILLLIGAVLGVQRSVKARFFQRRSRELAPAQFTPREARPLRIGGREARDLFELRDALDAMTRSQYEEAGGAAPVAAWVREELGERRLARRLRGRSKERALLLLDTHLKRLTRRLQKG